ncbi:non-ribosomal peptide synthetase [uncultured Nitratireductor sp.]|uniref:non-ribosomal peptide synthetase n=1 Tax=uncultured Nitratireductor sp. TaxID=520953 RepID=UPI0025D4ECFB|nr:non-ribosomal peptide synthetase [uncultured Nitratireductor sp.]
MHRNQQYGQLSGVRPVNASNHQSHERAYDRDATLHETVAALAREQPDAVAISFDDESLTYGELDRLSAKLAARLAAMGVRKGDVVGLLLPRALKTLVAKLAILKTGAAYAPFDPAYPLEHLGYMTQDCTPRALIIDRESATLAAKLPIAADRLVDIDTTMTKLAEDDAPTGDVAAVSGADAAYVMYTSGSTGRPKGVVIPHRGVLRLVRAQNFVAFRPDDVVLHAATISFDAATFEIWGALLNGSHLVGIGDRTLSMQRIVDAIDEKRVSVILLTTGLFNLLVDHHGGRLHSLRHALFGGEVASADHARRFLAAYPACRLSNAYGPTEVTVIASTFDIPASFQGDALPIGHSIAHGRVHILDENLNALPPGAEGQLAVSGDGLAIGYLNRPELTQQRFVTISTTTDAATAGEPLRAYLTGDMAAMDTDGLLHFRGRRDRQVKIDGKRIELDEIETALRRDRSLADAVVQCHQAGSAKRLVAYLRPRTMTGLDEMTFAAAVLGRLKGILPAHMVPGRAIVLQEFPLNRAGKVDRARLPNPAETPVPATVPDLPSKGMEAIVARHWRKVLGTNAVGPDQNFFDLGGTSMQLMRVHAALERELGRAIDVVTVFEHPKIRSLARFLEEPAADGRQIAAAQNRAARQKQMMSQFRRSRT